MTEDLRRDLLAGLPARAVGRSLRIQAVLRARGIGREAGWAVLEADGLETMRLMEEAVRGADVLDRALADRVAAILLRPVSAAIEVGQVDHGA